MADQALGVVKPPTVLYVTGAGRSATTLVGAILNEVEGCFYAGELRHLWREAVPQGTESAGTCGCGKPLPDCPVWSGVLGTKINSGVTVSSLAATTVAWQRKYHRIEHVWRLLRPYRVRALTMHAGVMALIYRSIHAATGARVIVDTSKTPWEATAVQHAEGITTKILHMVRDPRAVAYSGLRKKGSLPTMGVANSMRHWIGFNLAAEVVTGRRPEYSLRLRYEDFVQDPERCIQRVLDLVGMGCGSCPGRDGSVVLGTNHTVFGNPDRRSTGKIQICEDDAWRRGLSARQALGVAAMTLPLLRRYGYLPRS